MLDSSRFSSMRITLIEPLIPIYHVIVFVVSSYYLYGVFFPSFTSNINLNWVHIEDSYPLMNTN